MCGECALEVVFQFRRRRSWKLHPPCPFCRRPSELLSLHATKVGTDFWLKCYPAVARVTGKPAVHLQKTVDQGFHSIALDFGFRVGGGLGDGLLLLNNLNGAAEHMDEISLPGDRIHTFVDKFMGGHWPQQNFTLLRLATFSGPMSIFLFVKFRNKFWTEPVVVLGYGIVGVRETFEIELSDVKSLQVLNPWNVKKSIAFHGMVFDEQIFETGNPEVVLEFKNFDAMRVTLLPLEDHALSPMIRCESGTVDVRSIRHIYGPLLRCAQDSFIYKGYQPAACHRIRTGFPPDVLVEVLGFYNEHLTEEVLLYGAVAKSFIIVRLLVDNRVYVVNDFDVLRITSEV